MFSRANVVLLLTIFSTCSLSAQIDDMVIDTVTVYDTATGIEEVTIVKSIKDNALETKDMIIEMDTITTFSENPPHTRRVSVVKNYYDKKTGKSRIVTKDYGPGSKLVETIDTVITFNPATNEEQMEIFKIKTIVKGKL